jgi:hypothetical protein
MCDGALSRALAFHGDVFWTFASGGESPEGGVGVLAVQLDGRSTFEPVALRPRGAASVPEQFDEHFRKEFAQEFRFLHCLRMFRAEQVRPVP